MAKAVTDLANRTPGKEAVAMESFAKALRMVSRLSNVWRSRPRRAGLKLSVCLPAADHHRRQRRLRQRRPGGPAESGASGEQDHVWTE